MIGCLVGCAAVTKDDPTTTTTATTKNMVQYERVAGVQLGLFSHSLCRQLLWDTLVNRRMGVVLAVVGVGGSSRVIKKYWACCRV